jgi:hypothetical protein
VDFDEIIGHPEEAAARLAAEGRYGCFDFGGAMNRRQNGSHAEQSSSILK